MDTPGFKQPGDLELHVMCCLAMTRRKGERGERLADDRHSQAIHGYGITQWLGRSRGLKVRCSTIYRIIDRLVQGGFVEFTGDQQSTVGGERRLYRLTDHGCEEFSRMVAETSDRIRNLQKTVDDAKAVQMGQGEQDAG